MCCGWDLAEKEQCPFRQKSSLGWRKVESSGWLASALKILSVHWRVSEKQEWHLAFEKPVAFILKGVLLELVEEENWKNG